MITTAMKAAIEELAPPFERASGHMLRVIYGPSGGLTDAIIGNVSWLSLSDFPRDIPSS
jgi:hypothetical protein